MARKTARNQQSRIKPERQAACIGLTAQEYRSRAGNATALQRLSRLGCGS
jgi:DNA topoisomerase IB